MPSIQASSRNQKRFALAISLDWLLANAGRVEAVGAGMTRTSLDHQRATLVTDLPRGVSHCLVTAGKHFRRLIRRRASTVEQLGRHSGWISFNGPKNLLALLFVYEAQPQITKDIINYRL